MKQFVQYISMVLEAKFRTITDAYRHFDYGKKGFINLNDFRQGFRQLGRDCLMDNEMENLFSFLDRDGNGQVTFEEFKDILYF